MSDRVMLLVEDTPNDVKLTIRALKKNPIANDIVIAGDGVDLLSKPVEPDALNAMIRKWMDGDGAC